LEIQSFGKRIELWTEITHLRAHSMPSPDRAEFIRSSSRAPRSTVTTPRTVATPRTATLASPRLRSSSTTSVASQMMAVPENEANFETRALPELPLASPLPSSSFRPQTMQLPAVAMVPYHVDQEDSVSEAGDEASVQEQEERRPVSRRTTMRRKGKRSNVRMPQRSVAVESIIITSDDDLPGNYIAKIEALTSFDNSNTRPIGRTASKRISLAPSDSVSLRATRGRKKSEAIQEAPAEKKSHAHRCKKGDRCRKHGKQATENSQQQRQGSGAIQSTSVRRPRSRTEVKSEHGTILIATTPSIADFSKLPVQSLQESSVASGSPRPQSYYAASAVPSSDALGPIQRSEIQLKEGALRDVSRMDPLENVRAFLTHQHLQHLEERRDSPPPVPSKSNEDLIRAHSVAPPPSHSAQLRVAAHTSVPVPAATPTPPMRSQTPSFGLRIQGMEQVVPPYANFAAPNRTHTPNMMRTTTPFSEADVPCSAGSSAINFRDQSQSVPPDMHYRRFPTPTLESLRAPINPTPRSASIRPPNLNIVDENAEWEAVEEEPKMAPSPHMRTHSGWMKKRRTNWFRHEWPDYHFVLKGTRLGYASDVGTGEVGAIDMDQYQVACSNSGSTKLSAAFKAGRIFGKKKDDGTPGSYFFQLVPANEVTKGAKKTLGKVHCFAVGSREERIDWMRELMLAKAIKQKGQGFEVEVNGERV
jgi:hypothetical protein